MLGPQSPGYDEKKKGSKKFEPQYKKTIKAEKKKKKGGADLRNI